MDHKDERPDSLAVAVGAMGSDIKHLIQAQSETRAEYRENHSRMDLRLTAVEQFMWRASTLAVLASILLPIAISALGVFIGIRVE